MKYKKQYHVFYSGCIDNTPTKPDYKDTSYRKYVYRNNALVYAHDMVNEMNKVSFEDGYIGVEYGVCEITVVEEDKLNFEKRLSNINEQINTLNKESIETNIIVKKTLDSWLEKNGERIIKEYIRKFNPGLYMKMKFKENEERIKSLERRSPKPRKDGCYQFTYCNECLAYPMGLCCPNLVKGPVQLKGSEKPLSCNKCDLYGECDHRGAYKKDGKWCYE